MPQPPPLMTMGQGSKGALNPGPRIPPIPDLNEWEVLVGDHPDRARRIIGATVTERKQDEGVVSVQ